MQHAQPQRPAQAPPADPVAAASEADEAPCAGEIWRSRTDPAEAVMVLRRDADAVDYAWLDRDAADGRMPLAQWPQRFEVVLEQADHTHATPVRRHWLIDTQAERLRGARVLELGAHTGGLTEALLAHAAQVTAVENNPRCVRHLRERFGERLDLVAGDMHHVLWDLGQDRFDVVVCAGVLYHSAHPFLLLEAMAHLRPRAILVDTLDDGVAELRAVVPNLVNSCNYRYNRRPDCGYSLVLGERLIAGAMARLGYAAMQRIDTAAATIAPQRDSAYFQQWRRSLSAWFLRDGGAA
ncbi:Methyltransferase domain-containing protein [Lysobacter sp. yr284]|uniref:class I SAM-dependent methyltransferase n=1 Tax=Lysobacter sp. yr284 TaxID=1761791 RepID=UPI00089BFEC6|nr:methyltransferase domain-containing protein [Lysobacter sp. yr284]SDY16904.1 Methyltransferase domain-containing protein [Lysobacter sp. yr284]